MTSAEMNKELKKLQHERTRILEMEETSALFVAATTEKTEELRPEYNLRETNDRLIQLEKEIRKIKHRLNVFNSTYLIEELGMTIDEVLVFLPQQTQRVEKLEKYAKHPVRMRCSDRFGARGNLVEYEYANFSREEAVALYNEAHDHLTRVQLALDKVNTSVKVG